MSTSSAPPALVLSPQPLPPHSRPPHFQEEQGNVSSSAGESKNRYITSNGEVRRWSATQHKQPILRREDSIMSGPATISSITTICGPGDRPAQNGDNRNSSARRSFGGDNHISSNSSPQWLLYDGPVYSDPPPIAASFPANGNLGERARRSHRGKRSHPSGGHTSIVGARHSADLTGYSATYAAAYSAEESFMDDVVALKNQILGAQEQIVTARGQAMRKRRSMSHTEGFAGVQSGAETGMEGPGGSGEPRRETAFSRSLSRLQIRELAQANRPSRKKAERERASCLLQPIGGRHGWVRTRWVRAQPWGSDGGGICGPNPGGLKGVESAGPTLGV
eukprot:543887-Prorocentrum_minimum.AAC.4